MDNFQVYLKHMESRGQNMVLLLRVSGKYLSTCCPEILKKRLMVVLHILLHHFFSGETYELGEVIRDGKLYPVLSYISQNYRSPITLDNEWRYTFGNSRIKISIYSKRIYKSRKAIFNF
ncbi:hypothetical protein AALH30_22480 [Blautia pseudococcoides]|uniref:hypothetical protein n=1 Tax=Blautia pseudococcoides TaxID=1796616 RepID=UPI00148B14D2|nr:hypothetical protein [Blautia pseudococcoides]QJU13643.1 hypothetical protein HL650_03680 [Blautia pseudococcoides]